MENEQELRKLIREWITTSFEDQPHSEVKTINPENSENVIQDNEFQSNHENQKET